MKKTLHTLFKDQLVRCKATCSFKSLTAIALLKMFTCPYPYKIQEAFMIATFGFYTTRNCQVSIFVVIVKLFWFHRPDEPEIKWRPINRKRSQIVLVVTVGSHRGVTFIHFNSKVLILKALGWISQRVRTNLGLVLGDIQIALIVLS